jgi:hypothetical protein
MEDFRRNMANGRGIRHGPFVTLCGHAHAGHSLRQRRHSRTKESSVGHVRISRIDVQTDRAARVSYLRDNPYSQSPFALKVPFDPPALAVHVPDRVVASTFSLFFFSVYLAFQV